MTLGKYAVAIYNPADDAIRLSPPRAVSLGGKRGQRSLAQFLPRPVGTMCVCQLQSLTTFFSLFFPPAHHWGAFIHKHSSIVTVFLSLTHSHVVVCFLSSHVHPALCLFPLVSVCTIFLFKLFTIKHFGAWAGFWNIMDNGRKAFVVVVFLKYFCTNFYTFSLLM